MIVNCNNCSTRIPIEDARIPGRAFIVKCPQCQASINVHHQSAILDRGALSVGNAPAVENPKYHQPPMARVYEPGPGEIGTTEDTSEKPGSETEEFLRSLGKLLKHGVADSRKSGSRVRSSLESRRALVCVAAAAREGVSRALVSSNYRVFVAENTSQALETLRNEGIDLLVLDPGFDPIEQGAAFITSEIGAMRTDDRRRLFIVHISPAFRSLDTHAAFISNVNMVLNPADIEDLPSILDRAVRSYNDLYHDLFAASGVGPI